MKRYFIFSCILVCMLFAGNITAQEKVKVTEDKTKVKSDDSKEKTKDDKTKIKDGDMKVKMKGDGVTLPYTATYSSTFTIGNPAHSAMILDMWKDWDDNAFERHDYWSDTVSLYLPDGTVLKGKTAVAEGGKKYRSGLTSAKSTIHAWVPLKSTDKNENWVAIWGEETDTWPDGKVETQMIHEIWRINKDGKIDFMRQFTGKPEKK